MCGGESRREGVVGSRRIRMDAAVSGFWLWRSLLGRCWG